MPFPSGSLTSSRYASAAAVIRRNSADRAAQRSPRILPAPESSAGSGRCSLRHPRPGRVWIAIRHDGQQHAKCRAAQFSFNQLRYRRPTAARFCARWKAQSHPAFLEGDRRFETGDSRAARSAPDRNRAPRCRRSPFDREFLQVRLRRVAGRFGRILQQVCQHPLIRSGSAERSFRSVSKRSSVDSPPDARSSGRRYALPPAR